MAPAHYELAKEMIGIKEIVGKSHNPDIVAMFKKVGHGGIKDDETAWCAAFVGAMLEEAGIASTRALNARSYLQWGKIVTTPRIGDVVVFKRGNSAWQGHVAFYAGETKSHIKCLGGNQANQVKISSYSKSQFLGYRRADVPEARVQHNQNTAAIPKEERQPLSDSWTIKSAFGGVLTLLTTIFSQLGQLNPFTQAMLVLALIFVSIAAYRRYDANRKGKIG